MDVHLSALDPACDVGHFPASPFSSTERVCRVRRAGGGHWGIDGRGTGKTPTLIALARYLSGRGFRVGVVSRGYGRRPMTVHSWSVRSIPMRKWGMSLCSLSDLPLKRT